MPDGPKNPLDNFNPKELQDLHTALYQIRIGKAGNPADFDMDLVNAAWEDVNKHVSGMAQPPIPPTVPQPKIGPAPKGALDRLADIYIKRPIAAAISPTAERQMRGAVPNLVSALESLGVMPGRVQTPEVQAHEAILAPEELISEQEAQTPGLGLTKGILEAGGGLTTPGNISLLAATGFTGALPKLAQTTVARLVSAGFTLQMAHGAWQESKEFRDAVGRGDYQGAERILGHLLVTGTFTTLAGKHAAAKPKGAFLETEAFAPGAKLDSATALRMRAAASPLAPEVPEITLDQVAYERARAIAGPAKLPTTEAINEAKNAIIQETMAAMQPTPPPPAEGAVEAKMAELSKFGITDRASAEAAVAREARRAAEAEVPTPAPAGISPTSESRLLLDNLTDKEIRGIIAGQRIGLDPQDIIDLQNELARRTATVPAPAPGEAKPKVGPAPLSVADDLMTEIRQAPVPEGGWTPTKLQKAFKIGFGRATRIADELSKEPQQKAVAAIIAEKAAPQPIEATALAPAAGPQTVDQQIRTLLPEVARRLRKGETVEPAALQTLQQLTGIPTEGKSRGEIEQGIKKFLKKQGEKGFVTFDALAGLFRRGEELLPTRIGVLAPRGTIAVGTQSPTAKGADIAMSGEHETFYSALARQLAPKMSPKMAIGDFINMLPKESREVQQSGILETLRSAVGQGKKYITRQEAVQLLESRLPQLKVTTTSQDIRDTTTQRAAAQEAERKWLVRKEQIQNELAADLKIQPSEARSWLDFAETESLGALFRQLELRRPRSSTNYADFRDKWGPKLSELQTLRDEADARAAFMEEMSGPRYEQYTLPGGSNYREVKLQLPEAESKLTGETIGGMPVRTDPAFRSPHFDEPNIVAHMRIKDRTGPKGEKLYFIEELQSDWAVALRQRETDQAWRLGRGGGENIPPMPFEGNWHELLLKQALREAAEGGYDAIAWTTGKQQADRYNLRSYYSKFEYDSREGALYIFDRGFEEGNRPINRILATPEQLPEYVGTQTAKLLLEKGKVEGDDLGYGGEHHIRLYDEMVPQFLKRYTERVGGKPATTQIEITRQAGEPLAYDAKRDFAEGKVQVHTLPITPEMRRSILRGQPMLSSPQLRQPLGLQAGRRGEAGFITINMFAAPVVAAVKAIGQVTAAIQSAIPGRKPQKPISSGVLRNIAAVQQAAASRRPTGAAMLDTLAKLPREIVRRYYERFIAVDPNSILADPSIRGVMNRVGSLPAADDAFKRARIAHGGGAGPIADAMLRLGDIKMDATNAGLADATTAYLNLKAYDRAFQVVEDKLAEAQATEANIKAQIAAYKAVARQGMKQPVQGARDIVSLANELNSARADIKEFTDKLANNKVVPAGLSRADVTMELQKLQQDLGPQDYAQVEQLASRVFDLNREALDILYQGETTPVLSGGGGIISEAAYNTFISRGKEYIPMSRILMDLDKDTQQFGPAAPLSVAAQQVIKELRGSELINIDPWEASAKQYAASIKTVARNAAAKSMVRMAAHDPTGLGTVVRQLRPSQDPMPGEGVLSFFEDGKVARYAVPELIAETMKLVDPAAVEMFGGASLVFTQRLFRRTTTSANLAFALVNTSRDITDAMLLSKAVSHPKDLQFIITQYSAFLKAYAKTPEYREFLRSGAAFATLQRNIDPTTFLSFEAQRTPIQHLKRGDVIKSIEEFNSVLEETTKLNTYMTLIKKGMSPEEAVWETRNYGGSPDFAAGGSAKQDVNLLIMFFNANVRGIGRTIERLNPVQNPKRLGILLGGFALMAYLLHQHNSQYVDDRGQPEWDHVSETDKKNYFVLFRDETYQTSQGAIRHRTFKLPKSHVAQLVFNPIQNALEVPSGKMSGQQAILDFASNLIPGQVRLQKGQIGQGLMEGLAASSNPVIRAPLEQALNRDMFRRANIVPKRLEQVERRYQYTPTTPTPLVTMGEGGTTGAATGAALFGVTGGLLGGTTGAAVGGLAGAALGAYGPSPMRMEHAVRTFLGGVGESTVGVADFMSPSSSSPVGNLPLEGDEAVAKMPVLGPVARRFVGSIQDQEVKDLEEAFYRDADAARTKKATFDSLKKQDPAKAIAYLQEPGNLQYIQAFSFFDKVQRRLGLIRDAQQRFRHDKTTPVDQLRKQQNELYKAKLQLLEASERIRQQLLVPEQ